METPIAAASRVRTLRVVPVVALVLVAALLGAAGSRAIEPSESDPFETQEIWLSGRGPSDAVPWRFFCRAADPDAPTPRGCGRWTTIEVPSVWEQQGFGAYDYGHDEAKHDEIGVYRRSFRVPEDWAGRRIELVFDGVMTDASVRVDGKTVGPVHRGGFYRFRRDVTELVAAGSTHELEVAVSKISADGSVEAAERDADYWVFGGIFRPVRLVAHPAESIDHLAFDPRHDGAIALHARLAGLEAPATLRLTLLDLDATEPLDAPLEIAVSPDDAPDAGQSITLRGTVDGVEPWSADTPRLYRARAELLRDGVRLHRVDTRIGFRTIELRNVAADALEPLRDPSRGRLEVGEPPRFRTGLFVNGRRVLLRGVNRHAFWPTTGRAIDPAVDRRDAEILKSLHVNAVRASHYPPNQAFLDAADELGLYVIDELAGWHDAYDTAVGRELVREMVERDVNRPSIILWANGNEGGWNPTLDEDFLRRDPQRRAVLWPDEVRSGVEAKHYPTFEELTTRLDPGSLLSRWRSLTDRFLADQAAGGERLGRVPLVLPTEMLHALYDGGGGAGLEIFWREIERSPLGLGGFLWAFVDEAILRTDHDSTADDGPARLDTDGNHAPDGVLGPYREPSGSVAALREVWAPVRLHAIGGLGVVLHNRFDHLDLSRCRLRWSLRPWPAIGASTLDDVAARGTLEIPPTPPGSIVRLELPLAGLSQAEMPLAGLSQAGLSQAGLSQAGPLAGGWIALEVVDPAGRRVGILDRALRDGGLHPLEDASPEPALEESASQETVRGADGETRVQTDGEAWIAEAGDTRLVLDRTRGTLLDLSARSSEATLGLGSPQLVLGRDVTDIARSAPSVETLEDPPGLRVRQTDPASEISWRLWPSGWVELSWRVDETIDADGPTALLLPWRDLDRSLRSFRWWGRGPIRVWGNRLHGRWGLWHRDVASSTEPRWGHEPKHRGLFDVGWATLETSLGPLTVVPSEGLLVGVLEPRFPDDSKEAIAQLPSIEGLSVWRRAPSIGTKFHPADDLAPAPPADAPFEGSLWLLPGVPQPSVSPDPSAEGPRP